MNNENQKSISETVISKIKERQIKMRPRIYFIFKIGILAFGLAMLTLSAIFLTSFIFFSIRQSGLFFLGNFGFSGIRIILFSMPWLLILGVVALIVTSEFFADHFQFVYKRPVMYSVLAIIIIVILGGVALDFTPLHANLLMNAQKGEPSIAGHFYREFGAPKIPDVHYGSISEITNDGFKINTNRGEELNIIINENTQVFDKNIKEGDSVMVFGKKDNQSVKAGVIQKIDENKGFLPPPRFFKKQIQQAPGALIESLPKQNFKR
jgi:uncharacterized SAM-binding protein YcdF (DUF218 family)